MEKQLFEQVNPADPKEIQTVEPITGTVNVIDSDNTEQRLDAKLRQMNEDLASKEFVNSSIQTMAANPVDYDAAGSAFPTKAALTGATTYYNRGVEYTPTKGDYSTVIADEGAPAPFTNGQTRYVYDGTTWSYSFGINETPFTVAQNAAINSGITSDLVAQIGQASGRSGPVADSIYGDVTYCVVGNILYLEGIGGFSPSGIFNMPLIPSDIVARIKHTEQYLWINGDIQGYFYLDSEQLRLTAVGGNSIYINVALMLNPA